MQTTPLQKIVFKHGVPRQLFDALRNSAVLLATVGLSYALAAQQQRTSASTSRAQPHTTLVLGAMLFAAALPVGLTARTLERSALSQSVLSSLYGAVAAVGLMALYVVGMLQSGLLEVVLGCTDGLLEALLGVAVDVSAPARRLFESSHHLLLGAGAIFLLEAGVYVRALLRASASWDETERFIASYRWEAQSEGVNGSITAVAARLENTQRQARFS